MKKNQNNSPLTQPGTGRLAHWPLLLGALALLLATRASAQVPVFSNVWNVVAGAFAGLPANAANNCRGIAINPFTTNVLYASSTGGTNAGASHVGTLDFNNGSNYLANLNGTGFGGGTVATAGIRVSDDGYVYACNVSGAPASTFKIWRWPTDTDVVSVPTVVYNSGTGTSFQWRLGDYIDLRGSGSNTEIVVVGPGSGANITTNFVIFRPTDNTATVFTNFSITIPGSSATVNLCGAGVAFEGTNNVIWIRRAGSQETRRISYNPVTLIATCDRTNTVDQSACQGLKYVSANGVNMLATLQAASGLGSIQRARVFTIPTSPTAPLASVLSSNLPVVSTSNNGNGLGNVDVQKGYLAFGAPGHGISLFKLDFITNSPPIVTGPSGGGTFIDGLATNTLTVAVSGSTPLRYQWYFNTNTPVGSNTNFLTLSPVQLANAGTYSVVVTNAFGAVTTGVTTVTVLAKGFSNLATQLWTLAPGSRDYLSTGDTQRGTAYDPIYQRLVLVSRSPTNGVHLLDAATGADLGDMDLTAILPGGIAYPPAGTFALNMCGVADDGAVYVGNLITSGNADTFFLYRWDGATNTASMAVAYLGNPLAGAGSIGRIGDTMAVRGAGTNTEILCSFRTSTNVAVFTTTDGLNFNVTPIAVTNLPADAQANGFAGLGIAFGSGNTFWAKSSGFNLRQVAYDVASGTAGVINTYAGLPGAEAPMAVDNANAYIALVAFGENPQNLPLYDLTAPSLSTLLDRELFGANNANANGTGSAAFDIAGGRLFALDSNNGLIALTYAPRLYITPVIQGGIVTWTGPGTLQAASLVTGPYVDVVTSSPYTNTAASQIYFRVRR